jgi:1-deoxy-D-xylulose-5-phosphate synthase
VPVEKDDTPFEIGKGEILTEGDDLLLLAIGRGVQESLEARGLLAQEGIAATVVNCRFVKPLDIDLIHPLAAKVPRIVTVEENMRQGGFGSAVLEALSDAGLTGLALRRVGVADTFVEHGPQKILRSRYGVDAAAIVAAARQLLESSPRPGNAAS